FVSSFARSEATISHARAMSSNCFLCRRSFICRASFRHLSARSRYARPLRIVLSQPLSRYGCRFTPHPRSVMSLLAVGDVSIRRTGRGGGGDRSAREIGRASCRERGRVGGGRGSSNSK